MLSGKNIIITGANRGIGKKTVEIASEYGANVWACARSFNSNFENDCKEIELCYGNKVIPLYFDLTNPDEIKASLDIVRKTKTRIDGLVNNAGYLPDVSSFWMMPIERIKHTFEINLYGPTLLTQYVTRLMIGKKNGGSIVNVASITGIDGLYAPYDYICSKAAIIGGTKYLSYELASYGIRVNAVAPGWTNSDMTKDINEIDKKQILDKIKQERFADADEISRAIIFLLSDLSSYITGQTLRVDGGWK